MIIQCFIFVISYVTAACEALKIILRNFGPVIKSNLTAPPSQGVDISREERYLSLFQCPCIVLINCTQILFVFLLPTDSLCPIWQSHMHCIYLVVTYMYNISQDKTFVNFLCSCVWRYRKCRQCYENLSIIRSKVAQRGGTPEKVGQLLREIQILMASMDWEQKHDSNVCDFIELNLWICNSLLGASVNDLVLIQVGGHLGRNLWLFVI